MNSNNYQLGSDDPKLNVTAMSLMETITELSHERNCCNSFPEMGNIDYGFDEENTLIIAIVELEEVYAAVGDDLHHHAHPYFMEKKAWGKGYKIYSNDSEYGVDINTSAPICGGSTPMEALKNAWESWSIPPVLILNADYYAPGIGLEEVY